MPANYPFKPYQLELTCRCFSNESETVASEEASFTEHFGYDRLVQCSLILNGQYSQEMEETDKRLTEYGGSLQCITDHE